MDTSGGFFAYLWSLLAFLSIFVLLLIIGVIKAALVGPLVTAIVLLGNTVVIVGLWPCHAAWTSYCILKTKKLGPLLKGLLLLFFIITILLWPIAGVISSMSVGFGYGFLLPVIATFQGLDEGVSNKLVKCFLDGTWSAILGGCTIVRDTADVCFHTYFSYMDGLLEAKSEQLIELRLTQIPGCALAGIFGIALDVPMITLIVIYKAPVMLLKGWQRLLADLTERTGPFLETICVPLAGLLIILWPIAVAFATFAGIISSFFLGCYASVVTYQEKSIRQGLCFVISAISMFDEYTNDFLHIQEGSCFPRPRYRKASSTLEAVPSEQLADARMILHTKHLPSKPFLLKMQELKAVVVWENLIKACKLVGQELIAAGAIKTSDLEEWQYSKNEIINIGLPALVFLQCFLRSIRSGSVGFVMRDNTKLTAVNRPEERVFDWFFEPMSILKEQIKASDLIESEEAYLCQLTLYHRNTARIGEWHNGGVAPDDELRRAKLEGISGRLHGFCQTISRMPTFRRCFHEMVKALRKGPAQGPSPGAEEV